jgi:hypothetical protein
MRLCWQALAVAVCFATPSLAEDHQETDIDMFAVMSGKCSTLKIAGRDFKCSSIAFFHDAKGRSRFTIALNDPSDTSHVVAFAGESAQRDQENLYELRIDRMLLNSKDRPRIDGLPVPSAESSAGVCRQIGNFATREVSSVSCSATDKNGRKYELQFESDGSLMKVQKIRQADLSEEERRLKIMERQIEQLKCRRKAHVAGVPPRDRTDYIIRCLGEVAGTP